MTTSLVALRFDAWYPGWLRRWCEAYLSFRGRGADADSAYVLANAEMDNPLMVSVWQSTVDRLIAAGAPLDMAQAQADVDLHGIQYATPWAGEDEGVFS